VPRGQAWSLVKRLTNVMKHMLWTRVGSRWGDWVDRPPETYESNFSPWFSTLRKTVFGT